jgi:hypothetical protein
MANNQSVTCAERMAFARHSNPSSHIAYIRAGHNSDFAFQKAVSGAPMPAKKEILAGQATAKKVQKAGRKKVKKPPPIGIKSSTMKAKMIRKVKCKVIRKATPPESPSYMKAPPKSLISAPATRAAVRKSKRTPKSKKRS